MAHNGKFGPRYEDGWYGWYVFHTSTFEAMDVGWDVGWVASMNGNTHVEDECQHGFMPYDRDITCGCFKVQVIGLRKTDEAEAA